MRSPELARRQQRTTEFPAAPIIDRAGDGALENAVFLAKSSIAAVKSHRSSRIGVRNCLGLFVHCCLEIKAQFPLILLDPLARSSSPTLSLCSPPALMMWREIREEVTMKSMDLSPTLAHKSGRSLTRSCQRSSKSPSHLLVWRSSHRRKSALARTQLHR
ncbi:hypothetical protein TIFTF001_000960 [Ficus carica]|uniref:Uncharacterized protein n=1 Tax=Ficus carica TaxID=3494 RepID=A0AA87ZJS0_FICCA|nr:hypothetical protein TIFTF001_000960 [Ficus carica]